MNIREDWSSSQCRIERFLIDVDMLFHAPLSEKIDLNDYSMKLAKKAKNMFLTEENQDVAHVAFYENHVNKTLFITSIAIKSNSQSKGLGTYLIQAVKNYAKQNHYNSIELEADSRSENLVRFYIKNDFFEKSHSGSNIIMACII
jgi:ribosomal protein S18 acetylase RimI-like enzyme